MSELQNKIKESFKEAILAERTRCLNIAQHEYEYWRNNDKTEIENIAMGGMAALANIEAAIILGTSVEEYKANIEKRDK
jgi:hypothetical protein